VASDDYGNILGSDRSRPDPCSSLAGIIQERGDFVGDGSNNPAVGSPLGDNFPILLLPLEKPELQRGGIPFFQYESLFVPCRTYLRVLQMLDDKWELQLLPEDEVYRLHQCRSRAPVLLHGELKIGGQAASDLQIGEDVGPPEAIDSLFRVTDQKQGKRAVSVDAVENAVLDLVGILKLVDERRPVTLPEVCPQGNAVLSPESVVHI